MQVSVLDADMGQDDLLGEATIELKDHSLKLNGQPFDHPVKQEDTGKVGTVRLGLKCHISTGSLKWITKTERPKDKKEFTISRETKTKLRAALEQKKTAAEVETVEFTEKELDNFALDWAHLKEDSYLSIDDGSYLELKLAAEWERTLEVKVKKAQAEMVDRLLDTIYHQLDMQGISYEDAYRVLRQLEESDLTTDCRGEMDMDAVLEEEVHRLLCEKVAPGTVQKEIDDKLTTDNSIKRKRRIENVLEHVRGSRPNDKISSVAPAPCPGRATLAQTHAHIDMQQDILAEAEIPCNHQAAESTIATSEMSLQSSSGGIDDSDERDVDLWESNRHYFDQWEVRGTFGKTHEAAQGLKAFVGLINDRILGELVGRGTDALQDEIIQWGSLQDMEVQCLSVS